VSVDGGILDGSVHAFYLTVGPWMVGPGQPMLDSMKETEPIKGMATEACGWPLKVLRQLGELDATIVKNGVDAIRNCIDKCFKQRGGRSHVGSFHQFDDREPRCAVDGYG
jgi:hypothetical protein